MRARLETEVLRAVSRSFYLSLRILPEPMRRPAAIAYLLARTSDTIADCGELPVAERILALDNFWRWVNGEKASFSEAFFEQIEDEGEKVLLSRCDEMLDALKLLQPKQRELVMEVLEIIISGQRSDLEHFYNETREAVSLPDEAALDDYTWRVAGCVGAFWTKLGYETMGESFSTFPQEEMLQLGIEYGKGLQLVNILRDLPVDLKDGRCYLPVENPEDEDAVMREFAIWQQRAMTKVSAGFRYAERLSMKRLRAASVLPAMIAEETLELLDGVSIERLKQRVKIPRKHVYRMLFHAWLSRPLAVR